jgi:hypothetical protein
MVFVCLDICGIRACAIPSERFEPQRSAAREAAMAKPKDPPGYPGDEAFDKTFVDNVRRIRLEKRLSVDQADVLVAEAMRRDAPSNTPRAIALVVRELREKRNMSRWALSRASGLSV